MDVIDLSDIQLAALDEIVDLTEERGPFELLNPANAPYASIPTKVLRALVAEVRRHRAAAQHPERNRRRG